MVRRAMSKKRRSRTSKSERGAFYPGDASRNITGCVANGIPEQTAEAIYNEMYDFCELRVQQGAFRLLRGDRVPDRVVQMLLPARIYGGAHDVGAGKFGQDL